MLRVRQWALPLLSACLLQAGCLERARNFAQPPAHSSVTAAAYRQPVLSPAPRNPLVEDYMARLAALQEGQQAVASGVRLRAIEVPVLPQDMVATAAGPHASPLFSPEALRRQVAIPDRLAPAPQPPAPEPTATAPADEPPQPPAQPVLAPDAVEAYLAAALARAEADPDDLDRQIQARLLLAAAGRDDEALRPIANLDEQENQRVAALLQMMMALRDREPASPQAANARLDALEQLQDQLRSVADLQIPVVKLCRQVDGYGVYTPFPGTTFLAGRTQPVIVYCEVRNFSARPDATGLYRTRLNMTLGLYNASGELAQALQKNEDIEDVSANRRHDFFLTRVYYFRDTLPPGDYILKITIEDPAANKVQTASIDVTLVQPQ
ncbi:MAG: hypothetical protein GX591_14665 [Planctomycetes bacterium]|nr:hypothetical protein [Planctomycetota bacterium]